MSKNIHEVEIKIEKDEWNIAIDKAFDKVIKTVKIDGFRQGKAPRNIYEKKYGKESLYMEAVDIILPDAFSKVLLQSKLVPVIQPSVNIKEINDDGVTFNFIVTTKPEVKLGEYTKLGVKKDEVKVTKEEIMREIDQIRDRYAEVSEKEGAIENGDIAIIDFEGFKDGVAFPGGKGDNYSLTIGSNTFIPGFEEGLIGLSKKDTKDLEIKFPDDYPSEELKGAKVVFKVKINEVKERVVPELNKDLFEDLGLDGVDSKESLEKDIESTIKARKESEVENKFIEELLKKIASNVEVEIPKEMIDEEAHRMVHQYEETLMMQGLTLEQFYKMTNSDEEALKDQMKGEARDRVTYRLMLEEICKKENIKVTEEEAKEEATKFALQYQMEEDEFLKMFGGLDMMKYDLEMKKTLEFVKDNN